MPSAFLVAHLLELANIAQGARQAGKVTLDVRYIWGFPEIRGTILGIPIIRIIVYLGLYWGPPILGNYHI